MNRILKRWLIIAAIILPLAAWAYFMPTQAIGALPGISCISDTVCTNDPASANDALRLYDEASRFISATLGPTKGKPIVVFCKSEFCFQTFGPGGATAKSLGTFVIVIGPRGWQAHYVRHEMIHFVQSEKMGFFGILLAPAWFREGMAYTLSEDPRPILAEPWQQYRSQFQHWYRGIDKIRLWDEAKKL